MAEEQQRRLLDALFHHQPTSADQPALSMPFNAAKPMGAAANHAA